MFKKQKNLLYKSLYDYMRDERGGFIMEFLDGKGAEQVISDYIEREMTEYKKVTDRELAMAGVVPEAKEAFNRKPYYNVTGSFIKKPVVK